MKQKNLLLLLVCTTVNAQSQKKYWKQLHLNKAKIIMKEQPVFNKSVEPDAYQFFSLNEAYLRSLTLKAPMVGSITVNCSISKMQGWNSYPLIKSRY